MTVREAEYWSAKEAAAGNLPDLEKQRQRFQHWIETSDWDERFIRRVNRLEKDFFYVVILLTLAISLAFSLSP